MRPVTSLNAAAGKHAQSIGVARLDNDQSKARRWIHPDSAAPIAIALPFKKKRAAVLILG